MSKINKYAIEVGIIVLFLVALKIGFDLTGFQTFAVYISLEAFLLLLRIQQAKCEYELRLAYLAGYQTGLKQKETC